MCHPGRRVHDVAAEGVGLPVRLPRCPDHARRCRSRALLGGRAVAGRDVRLGDAALRAGRDRLVRRGRVGVRGFTRRSGTRVGGAGAPGRPAGADPPAARRRGAVRGRRVRPDRRRGGRCPAGPGGRRCCGRRGRAAGAAGVVPRALEPAVAGGSEAGCRLQLRGDQHGDVLHPGSGAGGAAGRRPVARHRAPRGGDRHGRRDHRLRADPGRSGGEAGGAGRFRRHARRAGAARSADGRAGRARVRPGHRRGGGRRARRSPPRRARGSWAAS